MRDKVTTMSVYSVGGKVFKDCGKALDWSLITHKPLIKLFVIRRNGVPTRCIFSVDFAVRSAT